MRILQIRFKNLNSLTGEWSIDLTHPAYVSNGIFAITGPTGAGKTTILDAVCLALYSRTPRLKSVVKSGNEIMSRQTGECFAEVTLETLAGRFRCHWSQHRAHKSSNGELQNPKHEIADANSGQILESKLRNVALHVENVTGMDFERFTRSMLLAQGGFATFLQAPPDERAPILEQITGTEIYSQISIKVHERKTEECQRLDVLQAELAGMQLLPEDEERELGELLINKSTMEKEVTLRLETLRKSLSWIDTIVFLEKELDALNKQRRDLENKQKSFEPKLKQLARANKALVLKSDYDKVVSLRQMQNSETGELTESRKNLPKHETTLSEVLQLQQIATDKLIATKSYQKEQQAVIKKVREVDIKIKNKGSLLIESDDSIKKDERQREEYRARIKEIENLLKRTKTVLSDIELYLEQQAMDASLVENITAIAKMFDALREKNVELVKVQKELVVASDDKKAAVDVCTQFEATHTQITTNQKKAEIEHQQLTQEILEILKGRELTVWRDELDTLRERRRVLEQVEQTIERINETHQAMEELKKCRESLSKDKALLADEVNLCVEKKSASEKEVGHLEKQVALLNRIRDLDGERKHLEDGKSCPLCGAKEHPYAKGNIPTMDETECGLKSAKEKLKNMSDRLTGLQIKQVEAEKDFKLTENRLEEYKTVLNTNEKQCAIIFAELKIAADIKKRLKKIDEEMVTVQKRIAEYSRIITETEERIRKNETVRKLLETARAEFSESEKALQNANHRRETVERDHERLAEQYIALEVQTKRICSETIQVVQVYGIANLPVTGLDSIMENLTRRHGLWLEKQNEKSKHENNITAHKTEIEKQHALLSKLNEELKIKIKARDQINQQLEELIKLRRELYEDKETDEEEKRLSDAVDSAEKALEQVRDDCRHIEQDVSRLKERVAILADSTEKRALELAQSEQVLITRFNEAGFKDEADYQAACLPEEEREVLSRQEEALRLEQAELNVRWQDKSAALKAEREKKITKQPREKLWQELITSESTLKQTQQEIGAINQRLAENEKLRIKQQEYGKRLETQKKECSRWDSLHELIGSADGKKYRNFAQGITFEIMTGYANRQLAKMTDRYLLIRHNTQPLELNVIDNYQAGEIRSTKNLSGGESFIVSLALALGLSQMTSRNVRIDSLFLDEGFGTLDEEALETALETLAALQQDGKLIGVISHVSALKERISTQIQVIPETGGRSSINGPGCKRISSSDFAMSQKTLD